MMTITIRTSVGFGQYPCDTLVMMLIMIIMIMITIMMMKPWLLGSESYIVRSWHIHGGHREQIHYDLYNDDDDDGDDDDDDNNN